MRKKKPSISIFFPCYNDSKTIGRLVKDAVREAEKITDNFEVIVIDDGSKDNSWEILQKLSKKIKQLKLVRHPKNRGYGGALKSGFKTASKELIFYTDGDGQHNLMEFPIMLALLTPDIDFVNGIRMIRNDYTYRVVLGNLYHLLIRWAFLIPIIDVDCDYRLIRSKIIKKLDLQSNSGPICIELAKRAQRVGARFSQVTVHHYDRKFGTSEFWRPKHLITTFYELIILWFRLMIIDTLKKPSYAKKGI